MSRYLHILLLIVHGDDKAWQLGDHVWPHAGESHLEYVDGTTLSKVLKKQKLNLARVISKQEEVGITSMT